MIIIKRDGTQQEFDKGKIIAAVLKAFVAVDGEADEYAKTKAENIASFIETLCETEDEKLDVEAIQDMVERGLCATKRKDVAKAYILYRNERSSFRNLKENLSKKYEQLNRLLKGEDEESNKENSNKDTRIIPTMRDYIAGFTCRELANNYILPKEISKAHNDGLIHFHDTDYSPAMPMTNCCLINLEDMLQNSTVISGTLIEKPHSFRTACTIVTQIITQVASSQYGGNSINLAHIAPFVDISRQRYKIKYPMLNEDIIEQMVQDEIKDGIQTIQYQLITMSTTNGQAPFTSVFMYLGDAKNETEKNDLALIIYEVLKQRIKGVKNEQGEDITTAFPKLLYVLDEENINGEYEYLTWLAAECSTKRLVPDYISAKVMKELKGDVYACMGCRSFLHPDPINHKYWGKFNQGVVTLNLPYVALLAKEQNPNNVENRLSDFWHILDDKLELCKEALMIRHNSLVGVKSDVAPILWQHGAYARLKPGEEITPLLYNGNSSISLGYAGLWECVYALIGEELTSPNGKNLGLNIMQTLNDACNKWKAETNIYFSVYGSPIESTTFKFAKALKKRFGEIKGVSDKKYITNSYHITPAKEIDAFSKLSIESEFQKLSPGGAISYIETPNMTKNIPAIMEVIRHIYNTILYAEINTMTSYCQECGCRDIKMIDDSTFECPQCGNTDFNKMNIALRICGYISTNPFNEGRGADIFDRVYHVGME